MKEDPRHIRISAFNYPLPDERIAKFPLAERSASKLLVYRNGAISESRFDRLGEAPFPFTEEERGHLAAPFCLISFR